MQMHVRVHCQHSCQIHHCQTTCQTIYMAEHLWEQYQNSCRTWYQNHCQNTWQNNVRTHAKHDLRAYCQHMLEQMTNYIVRVRHVVRKKWSCQNNRRATLPVCISDNACNTCCQMPSEHMTEYGPEQLSGYVVTTNVRTRASFDFRMQSQKLPPVSQ